MRQIKMKTISAGPHGSMFPNKVYSIDLESAKELVDGGYAVYETAMVKPVSGLAEAQAAAGLGSDGQVKLNISLKPKW